MTINSIRDHYSEIFKAYDNHSAEKHINKIVELDYYMPFNTTYFCVINSQKQTYEYISKNFEACTGIPTTTMKDGGVQYLWSLIHPNDVGLWLKGLELLMQFTMTELTMDQRSRMNYTWNYRIKNGSGKYINIIQNTSPLTFDINDKPYIGLSHYTVLEGDNKMDICATAKYLNKNNEYETLYHNNITSQHLIDVFSNRERDVIRMLLLKKTSTEIANSLFISKHTVDTHRRNILKKMNLRSTTELMSHFKSNPQLI